jgi:hypothetical protein
VPQPRCIRAFLPSYYHHRKDFTICGRKNRSNTWRTELCLAYMEDPPDRRLDSHERCTATVPTNQQHHDRSTTIMVESSSSAALSRLGEMKYHFQVYV